MKLIKAKDVVEEPREDGRTVKKLLSYSFAKPIDSLAIYLGFSSGGKLEEHYHKECGEIIIFPSGGGIEVNGREISLSEWDIVLLEPGETHGYKGGSSKVIHLAIKYPDKEDKTFVKEKIPVNK